MTYDAEYERYERDKEQYDWERQEMEEDKLREILRDVYDVVVSGQRVSDGLLERIRREMTSGRVR